MSHCRLTINNFQYLGHKRRRIDDVGVESDNYDNESLSKIWKAFKNAAINGNFLNLSEDASYLLGADDDDNPISTIFIRDCYLDLHKVIFGNNKSRWRITGNLGIGKTFFGYYLLYQIAKSMERSSTINITDLRFFSAKPKFTVAL